MKDYEHIKKFGRIKNFDVDKIYSFNSIDIETIDNELFFIGYFRPSKKFINYTSAELYSSYFDNFFDAFHKILFNSLDNGRDILTWSRYDNTHFLKLILQQYSEEEQKEIILRIGKVTPICTYDYKNYHIELTNIIKDSYIFCIGNYKITIYNIKNLFDTDLEKTAKDYKINYYSKLGQEFHLIDKARFDSDSEYKNNVLKSNYLDSKVLIDIADSILSNFYNSCNRYPLTIFSCGSLARSYLIAESNYNKNILKIPFNSMFSGNKLKHQLLEYAMKSYHGGKIESYILGYVKDAAIVDITSAYPYALSELPLIKNEVKYYEDNTDLDTYYYAFIDCDIKIDDDNFIHPITIESPISIANISPVGEYNAIITKLEYDYLIANNIEVHVNNYMGVACDEDIKPYKTLITNLFDNRMIHKVNNPAQAHIYKIILNSLYGITMELTDIYEETPTTIDWTGYRAGNFFNPVIASYITAFTRTYLSRVSQNIINNGGEVYLNMTDSIIYKGKISLDNVISEEKTLGKLEPPEDISDIIILGSGRYEYKNDFTSKYVVKNRGFAVTIKDSGFYKNLELVNKVEISHRTFVSYFKATTKKYNLSQLGHLIDDNYYIDPFNLGDKRIIVNRNINLKTEFTYTKPLRLERGVILERKIY